MNVLLPKWFYVLNIFTACFGMIYYFSHAYSARKDDSRLMRLMIVFGFISCGVILFFSIMMLYAERKYTDMFLFFSWFSVFLSVPFLRQPRVVRKTDIVKAEDMALIEKPDDLIKKVKT